MHRTIFTHRFFGTEKNRHRGNCTYRLCKKKYTPILLHAETLPKTVFTQQKLFRTESFTDNFFKMHNNYCRHMVFTQKVLRTEVLRTEGFTHNIFFTYRRFYTQMPLHGGRIAHRNLCTQHPFTRNQFLLRKVLFPPLDHLPFVFPLSSFEYQVNALGISLYPLMRIGLDCILCI